MGPMNTYHVAPPSAKLSHYLGYVTLEFAADKTVENCFSFLLESEH